MSDLECFRSTSRIPKKYPRIGGGAFPGLFGVVLLHVHSRPHKYGVDESGPSHKFLVEPKISLELCVSDPVRIDRKSIRPACQKETRMNPENRDPNTLIRMEEVEALVGLDRSTIYRKIAAKTFAEQVRPTDSGYAARWRLGDILDWLESCPKRRRRDPIKARTARAKRAANAEEPARISSGVLDLTYVFRALVTPGSPTDVMLDVHRRYDEDEWDALFRPGN